jgi:hypothetical protein
MKSPKASGSGKLLCAQFRISSDLIAGQDRSSRDDRGAPLNRQRSDLR